MGRERRFIFQHMHHASPARECEKLCGEKVIPFGIGDSKAIQHFQADLVCLQTKAGLTPKLAFHAVEVARKEGGTLSHDAARTFE